jgi:hypothetical protein
VNLTDWTGWLPWSPECGLEITIGAHPPHRTGEPLREILDDVKCPDVARSPNPAVGGVLSEVVTRGGAMVEQAGRLNDRGRENDAAFAEIIAGSSPVIQELARAVRDVIYDVLPQTVEVVWPRQGSVGWGTGAKKFTEQFAYLMPFKQHVTLGFYHGGELTDPHGLLPKTGGRQAEGTLTMRSLRISSSEQIRDPALRTLIEAATVTGVPPIRE